ncbi:BTB/POZ protein [Diplogelasinospora grovesii]|uniref:Elongin-C n=1 Tax=Diplogelasinospora grovesii TaxID=303347 RepID=A0AAN6NDE6_9PEZI|nr:BTB/POZ protein [Diplogelasinospora grovesii]
MPVNNRVGAGRIDVNGDSPTANGDDSASCNYQSKYITLISSDGFEFACLREAALVSPTIKGMLRSQFSEAKTGRCTFPEISGVIMERIVEYFHYYHTYRDRDDVPDLDVPVELCLELLVAADFFGLDNKINEGQQQQPASSVPRRQVAAAVTRPH